MNDVFFLKAKKKDIHTKKTLIFFFIHTKRECSDRVFRQKKRKKKHEKERKKNEK